MVNNLDWTAPLSAIDFLRDVGKHYRLGTMLAKDTVARRLNSDAGISFTEFSYQILQGMDFLELYRRHGITLQTGGSDQWGNLLSGVELIRKAEGVAAHALTTPLITKADGTKFGKTESGTVWLDPEMTTPYAFFQFWLNADDADVVRLPQGLHVPVPRARSTSSSAAVAASAGGPRGPARARATRSRRSCTGGRRRPGGRREPGALRPRLAGRPRRARRWPPPSPSCPRRPGRPATPIADLLAATGVVASKGAARRAIAEGGASVNNVRVAAEDAVLTRRGPAARPVGRPAPRQAHPRGGRRAGMTRRRRRGPRARLAGPSCA